MPWHIGIDEAGYGPNLGPFVMTLVACRTPDDAEHWQLLKRGVRRAEETADHRLVVADSKQVYSPARGWRELERTVLAASPWQQDSDFADDSRQDRNLPATTLHGLLQNLCEDAANLQREAWFVGDTVLPTEVDADALAAGRELWRSTNASAEVAWSYCRCAIVPAPRFNDLIDRWDSKSAVLSIAVTELMRQCVAATTPAPMRFVIDKHGGRNTYSALLQHAFAEGVVLAEEEGRLRSAYRVEGLDRPVRILVTPRADVEHFTVALASMVSKYVRELLMREFNRFWLSQVPGLQPTAGYPNDAVRYIEAIRPAMKKLGIAERLVWRCR